MPKLEARTAIHIKQQDKICTVVPQQSPEDGIIDRRWHKRKIWNFSWTQTHQYLTVSSIFNEEQVTM